VTGALQRDQRLTSERIIETMLPRVLTSTDLAVVLIAITLFINNAAAIQPAGPAAFGWWALGFALFFVPGAVVTARLFSLLPGEGSVYLWTHRALGDFWGFIAGYCAWWPGVLALVALGPVALGYLGYALPDSVGSWGVELQGVAIAAVVSITGVIAVQRFRTVQTVVNIAMLGYGPGILTVTAAGVHQLLSGRPAAVDPTQLSAYAPSAAHGLNTSNWSFFGLVVLALLGVEIPLNMGAEIRRGINATRYLRWGSLAVITSYLAVTWAVMVTVPQHDAVSSAITPLPETVTIAFGRGAGNAVAAVFAAATVTMGVVYNYAFARLLFVSGLDRTLPESMTRLNRHRVPANAVQAQTGLAVTVITLAFIILPVLGYGGSPADVQTKVYDVLEAGVTIIWCLSMVFLFVDAVVLVRHDRTQTRARTGAPTGMISLNICCGLGVFTSLIAIVGTLSGSWTPLIGNSGAVVVFGSSVQWGAWSWAVLSVALASLLAGAGLYLYGERIRRDSDARMRVGSLTTQA